MSRLSLTESLKSLQKAMPLRVGERKSYGAAARDGLMRFTVAVDPGEHEKLKLLAVDKGRSPEDLVREALVDLFAKHAQ
jgi:hypothetical protein